MSDFGFKLSVITINLNNAVGLEKTIESVISQKFDNFEYIIIDGNSSDESIHVIKKYSNKINYWISEPDSGIYNAMNKAIEIARGEYLIFMNSGDCFVNNKVLNNVFSIKQESDLLVGTIIKDYKIIKEKRTVSSKITLYNIMTSSLPHQSTFIKRYLFDEIGLYDESKLSADWIFCFLAIFKYNKSIKKLEYDIALIDVHGISNSEDGTQLMKNERELTAKTYLPYFYDDYKELYILKRFTYKRILRFIKWHLRKLISK